MRRVLFLLTGILLSQAHAQDSIPTARAKAPPGHSIWSSSLIGSYFVPATLKAEYDQLLSEMENLQDQVAKGMVDSQEARKQLKELIPRIATLKDNIEKSKIHVAAGKLHTKTEQVEFEFGDSRMLVITADRVKIVPSDSDKVVCLLEKLVVSTDDAPAEEELNGIQLKHEYGRFPGLVGKTDEEYQKEEKEYLATEEGKKLTPEQRANRTAFLGEIKGSYRGFEAYRGQEFDTIDLTGLTHEQGNRQIVIETKSDGAGGTMRSQWRRFASLTVHVPKCKMVAVRGGLRGLEIEQLPSSLLVTSTGSHDRDYEAEYKIKGVEGNVRIIEFPIHQIQRVQGDVEIEILREWANSGSYFRDEKVVSYIGKPVSLLVDHIGGSVKARLGRIEAGFQFIEKELHVRNDHGNTTVSLDKPLSKVSRRIESEAGIIRIMLRDVEHTTVWGENQVVLSTSFGSINASVDRKIFEDFNLSQSSRNWRGIWRNQNQEPNERFLALFGLTDWLSGKEDRAGFLAHSRAGTIFLGELQRESSRD